MTELIVALFLAFAAPSDITTSTPTNDTTYQTTASPTNEGDAGIVVGGIDTMEKN